MGGTIAIEMTRLLRQQRLQVAVAMLDAPRQGRGRENFTWWQLRVYRWQTIRFHITMFLRQPWHRKRGYLREPFRQRIRRLATWLNNERLYRWALGLRRAAPPGLARSCTLNPETWHEFDPSPVDVPITVFRARVQAPDEPWDLGWSEMTSGTFDLIHVPGCHPYMFVPPHGQKLTAWVARMEQRFMDTDVQDPVPLQNVGSRNVLRRTDRGLVLLTSCS